MDIFKEREQFLKKELEEYEKETPMTNDERDALHWWVGKGHSVHENWSLGCYEGGSPIDFLDVYRDEKEEQAMVNAMSVEEREKYLLEEYGYDPETDAGQSMEEFLMEDSSWAGL